jgi:hypothetical protein
VAWRGSIDFVKEEETTFENLEYPLLDRASSSAIPMVFSLENQAENNPSYSPLPWWERARVRGNTLRSPPPSPSPIKGEGKWVEFSSFVGDQAIMDN